MRVEVRGHDGAALGFPETRDKFAEWFRQELWLHTTLEKQVLVAHAGVTDALTRFGGGSPEYGSALKDFHRAVEAQRVRGDALARELAWRAAS